MTVSPSASRSKVLDTRQLVAAALAVESFYIIALVIVIPIGRVAVAVTVVLAVLLAMAVGPRLRRGGRLAEPHE